MINIKDALFCEYMPDVPIRIGDVEVQLLFFISQSARQCTLGQPFEAVTQLMHIIKNDRSVRMTVFDSQGPGHVVFQPYIPRDRDQYDYETVQYDLRQEKD